jgi:2'-5' RNA ligase
MRMYSALIPPPEVTGALRSELDRLDPDRAEGDTLRWDPVDRWHITLAFYGEVSDPAGQVYWLRKALAGLPAPTVRLDGAGTFPGVLWMAVRDGPPEGGLAEVAMAAGAERDGRPYTPHLTLAKARRGVPREWPEKLTGFASEPWVAREAVLMGKRPAAAYEVVARFGLGSDPVR